MTDPTSYQLTLAPLIPPVGRWLAKAGLISFLGLTVLFELLLLLSGLGLHLWYAPLVLSLVMVTVMAAVLVPVIGGFCWLLVALTRYQLAEEGIRQGAAGLLSQIGHREVSWLEFRRLETQTIAGVTVVRAIAAELDPPIVIYHSLLTEPKAFWHTWCQRLPKTSVIYNHSQELANTLT